ncbi:MAG: hypothetical protein CVU87_05160 [Firmicutes bacterium HGW-Firmicutes-12]|jgi:hypothetical protein|nr:MAG: hypothetical protein CVU87_05160 [Firmicutes bacterium HGW-Firmicutes-12]
MTRKNLLLKANHNKETAEWAESNSYFDAAVSRFYYSLYEKVIFISKKEGFYSEPPLGADSHVYTITQFKKGILSKLDTSEIAWIASLSKLKTCRVCSDYKEDRIDNTSDYNLIFKISYNSINQILDKLI